MFGERKRLGEVYKGVFGTPGGRMVLNNIINRGGVFAASRADGGYEAGRRALALEILDLAGQNQDALLNDILET